MKTNVNLHLTCELLPSEKIILKKAIEIVNQFHGEATLFTPCEYDIISTETGEVISTNELLRVMGLLNGIKDVTEWEIHSKVDSEDDVELPF